jgi:hypothetical protein
LYFRKTTIDLGKDEFGNYKLLKSAAYSYQKLAIRNQVYKKDARPITAICNDYGYTIIGLNGSLQIIIIGTHELIHGLGVYNDGGLLKLKKMKHEKIILINFNNRCKKSISIVL